MMATLTTRRPPRAIVQRHAERAAYTAGADLSAVLGPNTAALAYSARCVAWRAIMAETGCSLRGLAEVWGCDHKAVHRGVRGAA